MLARNENSRSASARHWHIYVDFGGTIVPEDPIDPLLARFADPSWCCIEQPWLQGRLTARERLAEHCRQQGLRHDEFEDFSEATLALSERFTERPDQRVTPAADLCTG